MLKINGKNVHVVMGNPNDPNACTADGILINKTYRLIYTNGAYPEKFALKELSGLQLVGGMSLINSAIVDNFDSFGEFRSEVLIPVIENWGRKKMNMPYAKGAPKDLKQMLNLAFKGNKKHMEKIEAYIAAYLASKIKCFDPDSNTVLIKDAPCEAIDRENYDKFSEWVKRKYTFEQFIELNKTAGVFSNKFISKEELKKFIPQ